uniref:Uncharacterized protein n=1 Tax=Arundo donax TaxID=35708 RepID=A0A0A9EKQ1_ARUDO
MSCISSETCNSRVSETPMHPSRTPLHPIQTPMRDPGDVFCMLCYALFKITKFNYNPLL